MNLDRLKALIRLANNNPSENEANTAARRVCQELAKDDFRILNGTFPRTAADKMREHASNYGGNINTEDIFRDLYDLMNKTRQKPYTPPEPAKTWNDVRRSEEPQFRSSPPKQEYWTGGFRPSAKQEDFFRNAPRVDINDEEWVRWDEFNIPKNDQGPRYKYDANGKRVKISAMRKCTQCGLETETFRVKEEPFICNPCHWKEKL